MVMTVICTFCWGSAVSRLGSWSEGRESLAFVNVTEYGVKFIAYFFEKQKTSKGKEKY
jgi:hypothetical protein